MDADRLPDPADGAASDLIGRKATILGYSVTGATVDGGTEFVAHIGLDIEDGPRVFFQATSPDDVWRIVEEPRHRVVCPRCEGQRYDRGSCGLCGNHGTLDENGDPAPVSAAVSPADVIRREHDEAWKEHAFDVKMRLRDAASYEYGNLSEGQRELYRAAADIIEAETERADVLLLVGERDKAEMQQQRLDNRALEMNLKAARDLLGLSNAERERDGRQIAQLTEALERQDAVIEHVTEYVDDLLDRARGVNQPRVLPDDPAGPFAVYVEARLADLVKLVAVLAGEEDANG